HRPHHSSAPSRDLCPYANLGPDEADAVACEHFMSPTLKTLEHLACMLRVIRLAQDVAVDGDGRIRDEDGQRARCVSENTALRGAQLGAGDAVDVGGRRLGD